MSYRRPNTLEEQEAYNQEAVCCPYDNNHTMFRSRLLFHLARCKAKVKKAHLFLNCPYNFIHIIPKGELDEHMKSCPDKAFLKVFNVISDPQNEFMDTTYDFTWESVMQEQNNEFQPMTLSTREVTPPPEIYDQEKSLNKTISRRHIFGIIGLALAYLTLKTLTIYKAKKIN